MWPLAGKRVEKKEEETLQHDGIEMQFPRLILFMAENLFCGMRMCLILFGRGLNEHLGKWEEPWKSKSSE